MCWIKNDCNTVSVAYVSRGFEIITPFKWKKIIIMIIYNLKVKINNCYFKVSLLIIPLEVTDTYEDLNSSFTVPVPIRDIPWLYSLINDQKLVTYTL